MKSTILKNLRLEKKLTQVQLAELLDVKRSSIAMIESGKQNGGRELTKKVAKYFNVSIDYLEGISESGVTIEKDNLVSNFLQFLIESGVIKDENNIDENTEKMILDMVKKEVANIKKDVRK